MAHVNIGTIHTEKEATNVKTYICVKVESQHCSITKEKPLDLQGIC